jgi:hypothetical protein
MYSIADFTCSRICNRVYIWLPILVRQTVYNRFHRTSSSMAKKIDHERDEMMCSAAKYILSLAASCKSFCGAKLGGEVHSVVVITGHQWPTLFYIIFNV